MSSFRYTPDMIKFILDLKAKRLMDKEIVFEFNRKYNMNKSIDGIKDVIKKYRDIDEGELEMIALRYQKANIRLKDNNSSLRNENTILLRNEVKQESLVEEIEKLFKSKEIKIKPYKVSTKGKRQRELNLVLSDLHFGSDIRKEETGKQDYGAIEESRRFAYIIKEAIKFKAQYRDETNLNVLLLGDIIQNSLHDPRDGAPLAEQVSRAIYLLSQGLAQLSANFPKVTVYCNTGNHGRSTSRHHGRAVNQKWDSAETIIYYAVKQASQHLKNVVFIIPKTPYVSYQVFNKKIFATHGDTVLNPGYPGKAIKTGVLENQINKINASLKDADEYSVFIVGHVHTASNTHLANGAVMITNGAIVPSDEYAVSIGLMESSAGQYIFESVQDFPVGDIRYIKVNELQDKDKNLDSIIKPWTGFNGDKRR